MAGAGARVFIPFQALKYKEKLVTSGAKIYVPKFYSLTTVIADILEIPASVRELGAQLAQGMAGAAGEESTGTPKLTKYTAHTREGIKQLDRREAATAKLGGKAGLHVLGSSSKVIKLKTGHSIRKFNSRTKKFDPPLGRMSLTLVFPGDVSLATVSDALASTIPPGNISATVDDAKKDRIFPQFYYNGRVYPILSQTRKDASEAAKSIGTVEEMTALLEAYRAARRG